MIHLSNASHFSVNTGNPHTVPHISTSYTAKNPPLVPLTIFSRACFLLSTRVTTPHCSLPRQIPCYIVYCNWQRGKQSYIGMRVVTPVATPYQSVSPPFVHLKVTNTSIVHCNWQREKQCYIGMTVVTAVASPYQSVSLSFVHLKVTSTSIVHCNWQRGKQCYIGMTVVTPVATPHQSVSLPFVHLCYQYQYCTLQLAERKAVLYRYESCGLISQSLIYPFESHQYLYLKDINKNRICFHCFLTRNMESMINEQFILSYYIVIQLLHVG